MKTFSLKSSQISRDWYLLDASEAPLGRLATKAARLLIGKDKPTLTHHIDNGDFVIVINAASLITTGAKMQKKVYFRHSGYPGGLHQRTLQEQIDRDPTKVVESAVKGMLPVNKLRDQRLRRLKIYNGHDHNQSAQKPQALSLNPKVKK